MSTYLRYALATTFFAAGIVCSGLVGWSTPINLFLTDPSGLIPKERVYARISGGQVYAQWDRLVSRGFIRGDCRFPLWYPTLVLLLSGFAILVTGSRFTLRSAIIGTTVVAVLLGMAVSL